MKKIFTALFAIFIITFTIAFTVPGAYNNSLKQFINACQIIDSSYYYIDDGSDAQLLYRIEKQKMEMKNFSVFNPNEFTTELIMNGAKVNANLNQNPSGKNYVILDVYMEDCESNNFYPNKCFSEGGVEFTVIGNSSIQWKFELPF